MPGADRNTPWGSVPTRVIDIHQDLSPAAFRDAVPDPHADTVVSSRTRHVMPTGRRLVSRLIVAGVVPLGVVVLVVALLAGVFDEVPLLNVSAAAVTETLAAVTLIRSWKHPGPRWLRRGLPLLLGVTIVACVTTAGLLRATNTITDAYPASFGLWIAMVVLATVGLPFTGLRGAVTRRVAAYLAVPLTLCGALMLIDQEYGVWPQVGDMLGHFRTVDPATLPKALDTTPGPGQSPPPKSGIVVNLDVPATASHFTHRSGNVYLPPAYFTDARPTLPVLLMLAGSLGTPTHWARAGKAVDTADRYAAAHHGIAPILVFADQNGSATGDTECVDGPQGMAETYLTTDVRTFVVDQLHITATPARWGVVGFSEGGTCALDLVLRHQDIYTHIVDLGGDDRPTFGDDKHTLSALFGGSTAQQNAHDPRLLLAGHRYDGVTAWFTAGADDPRNLGIEQKFAVQSRTDGIVAHEFTGISGHNWQFASAAFARILPGLTPELGLT